MALKDKWKDAGKGIGHAFANFGKAMGTTAKVVVGKEESTNEEGKSNIKESWKTMGKSFGTAGKSLGKAAVGTVEKISGEDEEENKTKEEPLDPENVVEAEVIESKEDKVE